MVDTQIIIYILVGIGTTLGVFSCFYLYKFLRTYQGTFKKSLEYIFYSVSFFTLLVIEFGTYGIFGKIEIFSIILSLSSITAFLLMLKAAKSVYKSEKYLIIGTLQEKKKFLEKKSELLKERFYKRRIDEQIFKELLKDIEKEIIDIEAKIELEEKERQ